MKTLMSLVAEEATELTREQKRAVVNSELRAVGAIQQLAIVIGNCRPLLSHAKCKTLAKKDLGRYGKEGALNMWLNAAELDKKGVSND